MVARPAWETEEAVVSCNGGFVKRFPLNFTEMQITRRHPPHVVSWCEVWRELRTVVIFSNNSSGQHTVQASPCPGTLLFPISGREKFST